MVSPLPFLGLIGAVRVTRIDGELVVNPTLPQIHDESSLDLIVVGTKEALTMVEAGGDQVPETILEAFDLARRDRQDLRRRSRNSARRSASRSGSIPS